MVQQNNEESVFSKMVALFSIIICTTNPIIVENIFNFSGIEASRAFEEIAGRIYLLISDIPPSDVAPCSDVNCPERYASVH
jgi:hypothetical protein